MPRITIKRTKQCRGFAKGLNPRQLGYYIDFCLERIKDPDASPYIVRLDAEMLYNAARRLEDRNALNLNR